MQHPVASGGQPAGGSARRRHPPGYAPPFYSSTTQPLPTTITGSHFEQPNFANNKICWNKNTRYPLNTRVLYRYCSPHAMQLSGACSRHFSNSPNYGGPNDGIQNLTSQPNPTPSDPTRPSLGLAVVLLGLDWGFVSDWIMPRP